MMAIALLAPATASATSDNIHKVFVCKYVGTPGDNERLQTGNNPIDVDANAIEAWKNGTITNIFDLVGQSFADAQGRFDRDRGRYRPGRAGRQRVPAP